MLLHRNIFKTKAWKCDFPCTEKFMYGIVLSISFQDDSSFAAVFFMYSRIVLLSNFRIDPTQPKSVTMNRSSIGERGEDTYVTFAMSLTNPAGSVA